MAQAAGKRSVRITGSGSASGGVYDSIRITGEAQIHGSTQSETFQCTGNCAVSGTLITSRCRIMGEASVSGDFKASKLAVFGKLDVTGSARGVSMKIRGQLDVAEECEAEYFQGKGGFNIHGLLNAERIEIGLYGPCRAKEIGGTRITVKQSKWVGFKRWFSSSGPMGLTTETIEGDEIYLEYTKADFVRGTNVMLGPECEIGHVEYRNSLVKDKSASVRHESKI